MKVSTVQKATDRPQAKTLTIYKLVFVSLPPELFQLFIVTICAHNEETNQHQKNEAEEAHTDSKTDIICNSGKNKSCCNKNNNNHIEQAKTLSTSFFVRVCRNMTCSSLYECIKS